MRKQFMRSEINANRRPDLKSDNITMFLANLCKGGKQSWVIKAPRVATTLKLFVQSQST